MLPAVSQIVDVEQIRDGGSLQASFMGANGSKYCLWFQIINGEPSSERTGSAKFEAPIVFERLEFRSPNRFEWHSANEVEVTWEHASVLLNQFYGFPLSDIQARWLKTMEDVASLRGSLPNEQNGVAR